MNKLRLVLGILTLLLVGAAAGWFAGGIYLPTTADVADLNQPTPMPAAEENIDTQTGRVTGYDGQKLMVKLETGPELVFDNLTGIEVWTIADKASQETQPQKTGWEAVKDGVEVTVAVDKKTQKLVGLLVLAD